MAIRGRKAAELLESAILPVSLKEICPMKALHRSWLRRLRSARLTENGHWRNGGRKTGATVAALSCMRQDRHYPGSSRAETSHRAGWRLRQGFHPSDHLNQASAAPTSTASALSVERILQSAASARARPGAKPAHTHTHDTRTRETPLALEECGYACHGGCIAPLRHQRNAITGAMGSGDEQWIRGEKSPPRGDTPDNGKDRAKWAKSSS